MINDKKALPLSDNSSQTGWQLSIDYLESKKYVNLNQLLQNYNQNQQFYQQFLLKGFSEGVIQFGQKILWRPPDA
ncbi:hypothetical protein, partial [Membranihabitans maritimus]|uniref:hypothetical protein n=1 Tax=Membranihabitans maritimus TaxID=2904244 RepID=UPI001F38B5B5